MSEKAPARESTSLQFNVAQLLKHPTGARRVYDERVASPVLDEHLVLVAPLSGQVRLLRIGTGVLVTGELTTTVELECMRCLSEFRLPMLLEIEEEFRPTIDVATGVKIESELDQDPATLIDEHHTLDLTEVVRQDLWLSLPSAPVCRPDCKGLCPRCGQDRNQRECDCEAQPVDVRWEALLDTMPLAR
jgi:uncharacterized protein